MFFQRSLKGIPDLSDQEASSFFQSGIICNWWRRVHRISPAEILEKLSERNLDWHLNHYDEADQTDHGRPFSESTPFISLTAGVVERDAFARRNVVMDPFLTALRFATREFTTDGCVFYCYVLTLGRESLRLEEFAEEVRELNIYRDFLPFHHEGEITAKISIRGPQIEKWERYEAATVIKDFENGRLPEPIRSESNALYAPPEDYCNIRGLVT